MGGKRLRKAAWILLLLLLSLALLSICACRTSSKTERETVIRDTLRITRYDTVRQDVLRESALTVFVKDSTNSIQDTTGRLLYRDRLRTVYIDRDRKDSSAFYKAVVDSLTKAAKAREREKVVEKTTRDFSLHTVVFLVLVAETIFYLWKRKRNK